MCVFDFCTLRCVQSHSTSTFGWIVYSERHFLPRSAQDLLDSIRPYGFTILIVLFWVGDAGNIFVYHLGC